MKAKTVYIGWVLTIALAVSCVFAAIKNSDAKAYKQVHNSTQRYNQTLEESLWSKKAEVVEAEENILELLGMYNTLVDDYNDLEADLIHANNETGYYVWFYETMLDWLSYEASDAQVKRLLDGDYVEWIDYIQKKVDLKGWTPHG